MSITPTNSIDCEEPLNYLDLLNNDYIELPIRTKPDRQPKFPQLPRIPYAQKRPALFAFCCSWLDRDDKHSLRSEWLENGGGHEDIEQALQELGLWSGRGVPDSDWDDLIASATIAFAGLQESVYVGEYALIISHKRYLTAVREILSRVEAKGEVSTKLNPFVSEIQEQCDYMCELEEEIEKLDRETERLEEQARLIEEYPPDITEGHIAFIDAFELGLIVPDMLNLMDFFQSGGAL